METNGSNLIILQKVLEISTLKELHDSDASLTLIYCDIFIKRHIENKASSR